MKSIIVIKKGADVNTINEIKGYIEMRMKMRWFDRCYCQYDAQNHPDTVIFTVRTSKNIYKLMKEELEKFYPNVCAFIQPKAV